MEIKELNQLLLMGLSHEIHFSPNLMWFFFKISSRVFFFFLFLRKLCINIPLLTLGLFFICKKHGYICENKKVKNNILIIFFKNNILIIFLITTLLVQLFLYYM
jgi:hypothetical protein